MGQHAGQLAGQVAVITGGARGQGRSHALRLATEGADIVLVDSCADSGAAEYPLASVDDLRRTHAEVDALGVRVLSEVVDVRDLEGLERVAARTVEELGRVDVVIANAGISAPMAFLQSTEANWLEVVDVNLSGVWRTCRAFVPPMVAAGNGGSVILIGSIGGVRGSRNIANYVSAKHGLVGLMKSLANEFADDGIRVNTVHPTNVRTDMILNQSAYRVFAPDLVEPSLEDVRPRFASVNLIDVPYVEPEDISNAVLWLASDQSRYVTGLELLVDAGSAVKRR